MKDSTILNRDLENLAKIQIMGILATTFLGIALISQSAPQQMTVRQVMDGFNVELEKEQEAGASPQELFTLLDQWARKINYEKITVDEALALLNHHFVFTRYANEGISANLSKLKPGTDGKGFKIVSARAIVLSIPPLDGIPARDQDVLVGFNEMFKHPFLPSAIRTPAAEQFLEAVARVIEARNLFDSSVMMEIGKQGEKNLNPVAGTAYFNVYSNWRKANPNHQATSSLWKIFHTGIENVIEKAEKLSDKHHYVMNIAARAELESPIGRGNFIGSNAPEINFKWSSDSKVKKLSDLRGKVVILDFWATWCGPCIESMPKLRELQEFYKDKPVVVIGVTSVQGVIIEGEKSTEFEGKADEEIAMYPGYIERQKVTWMLAVSKQDVFNQDYGVTGIPHMVIIDHEGKVQHNGLNPATLTLEQKQKLVDPLVALVK